MKLRDSGGWSIFVYDLVYPGILGSMIYDSSSLLRDAHYIDWFYATQLLIVTLFALDYLHMSVDLAKDIKQSPWWLIVDGLIPLAFAVAYWSITREDYSHLFTGLSVTFFLKLIYPIPHDFHRGTYFLGKIIPFAISVVSIAVSQYPNYLGAQNTVWFVLIMAISYAMHVFIFTEVARSSKIA